MNYVSITVHALHLKEVMNTVYETTIPYFFISTSKGNKHELFFGMETIGEKSKVKAALNNIKKSGIEFNSYD